MAGLAPSVADVLLDKLSTDDEFRDLFESDPGAALSELGHTPGEEVSCLVVEQLADKAVIAQARDEIRSMLLGALTNIPHKLEA